MTQLAVDTATGRMQSQAEVSTFSCSAVALALLISNHLLDIIPDQATSVACTYMPLSHLKPART